VREGKSGGEGDGVRGDRDAERRIEGKLRERKDWRSRRYILLN